jgi:hypothetical protein
MRSMFVGALKTCCARSNLSSASANLPARWRSSPSLKSWRAAERSASVTCAAAGVDDAMAAQRARRTGSFRMASSSPLRARSQ